MKMDNPAEIPQPEASEEIADLTEIAVSVDNATFTPETIIETEMPVADAEAAQAAFTELMQQAVAESSGDLPPSPITDPPEPDSGTPVPPPNTLTGITDSNNSTFNANQETVLENIEGQTESVKGAVESLEMASEAVEAVEEVLSELEDDGPTQPEEQADPAHKPEDEGRRPSAPLEDLSIVAGLELSTEASEMSRSESEAVSAEGPESEPVDGIRSGEKVSVTAGSDVMKGGSTPPSQSMVTNTSEFDTAPGERPGDTSSSSDLLNGESKMTASDFSSREDYLRYLKALESLQEEQPDEGRSGTERTTIDFTGSTEELVSSTSAAEIDPLITAANAVSESAQQDLSDMAEKQREVDEDKANIREAVSAIQDELADWPDGETRTITYTTWEEQPDGSSTRVEKTVILTKEQAQDLLESLEDSPGDQATKGKSEGAESALAQIEIPITLDGETLTVGSVISESAGARLVGVDIPTDEETETSGEITSGEPPEEEDPGGRIGGDPNSAVPGEPGESQDLPDPDDETVTDGEPAIDEVSEVEDTGGGIGSDPSSASFGGPGEGHDLPDPVENQEEIIDDLQGQLENLDMQNMSKQQQILQIMSGISKIVEDTSKAVVRNGSDDEPTDDAGTTESGDGPGEANPQEGDIDLATSSISAPFIPGGTVLSAAISGVAQGSSSSLAASAGNGDSGGADEGSESQEEGESESGDSPDESSGESSSGGLEDLVNDNFPQDIEALFQMVMMESSEDAEQDLKDMADEMNAMNEAKSQQRELIEQMKKFKSEAGKALREQYNAQAEGVEVTLAYNALSRAPDGTFQLVEQSETLPREQADDLIGRLEETQVADLGQDDLVPVEDLNRNALKSNIRGGIRTLREEMLTLTDELYEWPDGETRTITYSEVVKQPDGSYTVKEVTKTMTKDEAKSLIASMENQITGMEGELDAIGDGLIGGGTGGGGGEGSETSLQGSITVASAQ